MATAPSVRVVVKLPYERPEQAPQDPPKIEWSQEKADILWKVIEKSRSVDAAGADWKGLAEHLEVPLPYLLYRVNARFQEEIRGLKDIQGALSPTSAQPPSARLGTFEFPTPDKGPSVASRALATGRLSNSKIGVRMRLRSLNSATKPRKVTSSSTLTLQAARNPARRDPSPPSDSDSSDDDAINEGDEKAAEAEEALNQKLADLQRMMTSEAIGLVADPRLRLKGKAIDRGRSGFLSPRSTGSSRMDTPPSRSESVSHSISSTSSQNGSIPEIPSPSTESHPQSPRHMPLSSSSSSPQPLSPRGALGPRRQRPLADRFSDLSSNQGSGGSSFTDLVESENSISESALESALMSNFGTGASRLSQFARSRVGRNNTVIPQ